MDEVVWNVKTWRSSLWGEGQDVLVENCSIR